MLPSYSTRPEKASTSQNSTSRTRCWRLLQAQPFPEGGHFRENGKLLRDSEARKPIGGEHRAERHHGDHDFADGAYGKMKRDSDPSARIAAIANEASSSSASMAPSAAIVAETPQTADRWLATM